MKQTMKQRIRAVISLVFVVVLVALVEQIGEKETRIKVIPFQKFGEGEAKYEMKVNIGEEKKEELVLVMPEQSPEKRKAQEWITQAKEEILITFIGKNPSLEQIRDTVVIKDSYCKNKVSAQWTFDQYQWVNLLGEVKELEEGLTQAKVTARVLLECGESSEEFVFSFLILPKEQTSVEELSKFIEKQIKNSDPKKQVYQLPLEWKGEQIIWEQKQNKNWLKVAGLGILILLAIEIEQKEIKKRQEQKRRKCLQQEYANFVSTLYILLSCGMSLVTAIEVMNSQNRKKEGKQADSFLSQELKLLGEQIYNGISIYQAFQEFGERTKVMEYRNLSVRMIQNQRKGDQQFLEMLQREAEQSFLMKKQIAKKLGEEASSKMLFPMMFMLLLTLVVLIIPAWMSIA